MWRISVTRTSIVALALGLMSVVHSGVAQSGYVTQEELNLQKLFIDANREKLLGAFEEAAELYKEVLSIDPDNDAAAYELSRVYESMERYRDALSQINRAIRLNPGNIWYHLMKGDILEGMEDYAGAIDVYRHLTTLNSSENYFFQRLVEMLLKTNQLPEALEVLNTFEKHAGVLPEIIRKKVDILDKLGRQEEALAELEKLIRVYPGNTEYLHVIASYCLQTGREDEAKEYYKQILRIDPNDAHANLGVADQYKDEGDDVQYLRSIISLMRNPSIALDAKVQELIPYVQRFSETRDSSVEQALGRVITELVKHHGDEAKSHALYADFLYSSGNPLKAIREYEKTLVLDKSVFEVWEQLMYIKAELQDMHGLVRTAKDAQTVFPNQASVYYMCGLAYVFLEDYEQGSEQLEQALIMSGRNADLRFKVLSLLGKAYRETDRRSKAYEALEKALEIRPSSVQILNDYSYMLALDNHNLDKASDMAGEALALSPNNPAVEHTLAWIAFRKGDFHRARGYIEMSMDHGGGDNYEVLEHYGDILYSLNETDDAVEMWQLSLERGNPSEVLKRKISERKIVH